MAYNLYLGADLVPVIAALNGPPEDAPAAVGQVWSNVVATDFPTRARQVAAEIARLRPDVLALSEVALWRSQSPPDTVTGNLIPNATHVELDFKKILLRELRKRHMSYAVRSETLGSDAEAPRLRSDLSIDDIRFTDRDVILVRKGMRVTNRVEAANYQTAAVLPILGGVTVKRSYVVVEVKVKGRPVRVIATHLEDLAEPFRHGQAQELLAGPAATETPLVVLGDFNTDAELVSPEPTYTTLLGGGLTDVWDLLHPDDPGFTWGQQPLLDNATSTASQRIDLVFRRGTSLTPTRAELAGASPEDRIDGLWPSDHAGVFAEFEVE
jgi:endonuclease/exonuclease/phosphatase family metal-dependent hydrolase